MNAWSILTLSFTGAGILCAIVGFSISNKCEHWELFVKAAIIIVSSALIPLIIGMIIIASEPPVVKKVITFELSVGDFSNKKIDFEYEPFVNENIDNAEEYQRRLAEAFITSWLIFEEIE